MRFARSHRHHPRAASDTGTKSPGPAGTCMRAHAGAGHSSTIVHARQFQLVAHIRLLFKRCTPGSAARVPWATHPMQGPLSAGAVLAGHSPRCLQEYAPPVRPQGLMPTSRRACRHAPVSRRSASTVAATGFGGGKGVSGGKAKSGSGKAATKTKKTAQDRRRAAEGGVASRRSVTEQAHSSQLRGAPRGTSDAGVDAEYEQRLKQLQVIDAEQYANSTRRRRQSGAGRAANTGLAPAQHLLTMRPLVAGRTRLHR